MLNIRLCRCLTETESMHYKTETHGAWEFQGGLPKEAEDDRWRGKGFVICHHVLPYRTGLCMVKDLPELPQRTGGDWPLSVVPTPEQVTRDLWTSWSQAWQVSQECKYTNKQQTLPRSELLIFLKKGRLKWKWIRRAQNNAEIMPKSWIWGTEFWRSLKVIILLAYISPLTSWVPFIILGGYGALKRTNLHTSWW